MQKVKQNISQITPGMKLAEPITNASGITLMPAGMRLTPMFICKQIIEEGHGGKIWLESEVGKGLKFYVRVPMS